jgi:hypothetical protein
MMKSSFLCISLFYACIVGSVQNNKIMETFNVEEFKKNAIGGVYNKTINDGTQINQFGNTSSGFVENIIPAKGWFYEQRQFYGNGLLKAKGKLFRRGDFKAGIWLTFDDKGNKTEEVNYDSNFKLSLEDVFDIIKKKNIPFSVDNIYNSITRGNASPNSPFIWIVEWKALPDRIERIEINDSTGKITNQDFTPFNENH